MTAPSHEERSAARLAALQALYQLEITGIPPGDVIEEFIEHRFARHPQTGAPLHDEAFFADVVQGVLKHQIEIDRSLYLDEALRDRTADAARGAGDERPSGRHGPPRT